MSETSFPICLANVLRKEGGFVNDSRDPGGATMQGITQRVYNAFRTGKNLPVANVKFIGASEVSEIYRGQYWDAVQGDLLPSGVDNCIFDEGVNSGPIRSVMDLQKVLGVTQDGHLGMITLGALRARNASEVINSVCDLRLSWLRRLLTWRFFGAGWSSRVEAVRRESLKMIV